MECRGVMYNVLYVQRLHYTVLLSVTHRPLWLIRYRLTPVRLLLCAFSHTSTLVLCDMDSISRRNRKVLRVINTACSLAGASRENRVALSD